jgi:hypothetical protein
VLAALRATDELSWIKAMTQILPKSDMKGVNNKDREYPERAMIANTGFTGTCYTSGEVGHRSSDHFDQGRHHGRRSTRHGARGAGNHANRRQGGLRTDRQGHGDARQGGACHDTDRYGRARQDDDQRLIRFAENGNEIVPHARAVPAIGYHHRDRFNDADLSPDDDQFAAPLPPLRLRTLLVINSTRRLLSLILVPRGTCSMFCRPDQCSLTNSYVDNNSSLISE